MIRHVTFGYVISWLALVLNLMMLTFTTCAHWCTTTLKVYLLQIRNIACLEYGGVYLVTMDIEFGVVTALCLY